MNDTDKPMPLIAHLTELRSRLIKSAVFFIIMVCLCFYFSQAIFVLLLVPLKIALGEAVKVSYFAPHEAFFVYMNLSLYCGLIASVPMLDLSYQSLLLFSKYGRLLSLPFTILNKE